MVSTAYTVFTEWERFGHLRKARNQAPSTVDLMSVSLKLSYVFRSIKFPTLQLIHKNTEVLKRKQQVSLLRYVKIKYKNIPEEMCQRA